MDIRLLLATNETIDDIISRAAIHFFDGSESQARANLGPFNDTDTSFVLAYEGSETVGTVTIRWHPHYPRSVMHTFHSYRILKSATTCEVEDMARVFWQRLNT